MKSFDQSFAQFYEHEKNRVNKKKHDLQKSFESFIRAQRQWNFDFFQYSNDEFTIDDNDATAKDSIFKWFIEIVIHHCLIDFNEIVDQAHVS